MKNQTLVIYDFNIFYEILKEIENHLNFNLLNINKNKIDEHDVKNQDNQIYLNAVLIDNNKMYNKEELKRYINYKSAYLGKNIDMILLIKLNIDKINFYN